MEARGISALVGYWPRRVPGLPPGQRRLTEFPRFGTQVLRPPPIADGSATLRVEGAGLSEPLVITADDLDALPVREQQSDFHCVTTWSRQGLTWTGTAMRDVWQRVVEPRLDPHKTVRFVQARGADRHTATLALEDLLGPDVLLARRLDGAPLDPRHGAPLRLVSPSQYGYKSVKHLSRLFLHEHQPPGRMGAKEHLRARVAMEERHSRLPAWLVRVPYRATIPLTALVAERSATRASGAHPAPADETTQPRR